MLLRRAPPWRRGGARPISRWYGGPSPGSWESLMPWGAKSWQSTRSRGFRRRWCRDWRRNPVGSAPLDHSPRRGTSWCRWAARDADLQVSFGTRRIGPGLRLIAAHAAARAVHDLDSAGRDDVQPRTVDKAPVAEAHPDQRLKGATALPCWAARCGGPPPSRSRWSERSRHQASSSGWRAPHPGW